MEDLTQVFEKMEHLLDQLVDNAHQLNESSKQLLPQTELDALQKNQETLLEQLKELDKQHNLSRADATKEVDPAIQTRLNAKLKKFQQLHAAFIENLNKSHGMVKFDLNKKPPTTNKPKNPFF